MRILKKNIIIKKENHTNVLIAGAGPTGLMMACQLAYRNINFRIIDKKASFPVYSGAMLLHSRTMEFLDNLNIATEFMSKASLVNIIEFLFGKNNITIDFDISQAIKNVTKFPGILKIKQSETEKILSDFIINKGYKVEYGTELISFVEYGNFVVSKIKTGDNIEFISSNYLIAADGAHSTIRKQLKIPFNGKTFSSSIFVMDCTADIKLDRHKIHFLFSDTISAGFFALDEDKWRIDGAIQKGTAFNSIEEIKNILSSNNILNNKKLQTSWFSLITLNQRIASHLNHNRIFLAGDAAHVHSPVGAQGMNTGMHDAVNLGWKLALVISGKAKENILNSYNQERHEIAEQVIRSTYKPFLIAVNNNKLTRFFRPRFLSWFLIIGKFIFHNFKKLNLLVYSKLSGIGISYSKSLLTNYASYGKFNKNAPKPGERWPLPISIKTKYFVLIVYKNIDSLENLIKIRYFELISLQIITENYKFLDINNDGFYLIRPDNYIAYRAKHFNLEHFQAYIDKILY